MFLNYAMRVNQSLDKILSNQGALTESMRYSVLAGGKRFRPILTYTVAQTFNTNLNLVDSSACAVELIHAYSLIHDDLPAMDNDDIRHNQPSCHHRFGEAQAILTGDGLQALAFEVLVNDAQLSNVNKISILQVLASAAFKMAQGQSIDLGVVAQTIDVDTLKNMHQKKTGALLSCAVKLGALISNCSDKDQQTLSCFSKNIGLAYQIQDDVLDISSSEDVLGKNQNSDIDKNKPTYPALLGLEESKTEYKKLYQRALADLNRLSRSATQLKKLTHKLHNRTF